MTLAYMILFFLCVLLVPRVPISVTTLLLCNSLPSETSRELECANFVFSTLERMIYGPEGKVCSVLCWIISSFCIHLFYFKTFMPLPDILDASHIEESCD